MNINSKSEYRKRVLHEEENLDNQKKVCREKINVLKSIIDQRFPLLENHLDKIETYILNDLEKLLTLAIKEQRDIHQSSSITNLPLTIDISKKGTAILNVKSEWGEALGEGQFSKVKLSILLSNPSFPFIARSSMTFSENWKKNSEAEIHILKKIANYLEKTPYSKGLFKLYDAIEYIPIHKSVNRQNYSKNQELQTDNKSIKRALMSKYYNGNNLEGHLKHMTHLNKLRCTHFLLGGLSILHGEMNIFHSDIKPDNIFLEFDGDGENITDAVIGDFGLSCDLSKEEDRFFKDQYYAYRAPELMKVHQPIPIDENILLADIYSMGLILRLLFSNHKNEKLKSFIKQMTSEQPLERPSAQKSFEEFSILFNTLNQD